MLQKPDSHGFELICHVPTFCSDIVIRDAYAYLTNGWDGFSILGISNIASPALLSKLNSPHYAWGLNMYNNIAYIAEHPGEEKYLVEESDTPIAHPAGVNFIDVSKPNGPFEIDRFIARDFVDDVIKQNDYLLILSNHFPEPFTSTLLVVHLQNNKTPVQIGACHISGRGYQLAISGEQVYVAAFDGLHVIDISQPENPYEIFHVGNHLSLEGHSIQCNSQNLFVASYFQGLRIFKIQRGAQPTPLSRTLLWGIADNITINGDTGYVSDTFYGVWRFDLVNPEKPVETGFFPLEHGDRKVAVANSHIFVAAGRAGLFILRETQGQRDLNISHKPGHTVVFDD